ncbi:LysR family transcriptional regulator [Tropicimonas sp. IMCC34011]|uniref:LysR family transcriptional regulator n=1 Tax=Tropicimonas sp. IMCC34011 TaxID=2248759 RepID=UPI000E24EC87|nr:LysR family transcriptional regulator [Tropicimonas sp. IMCC34011]
MTPGSWDEIRTAYQVARLGTVSGAAQALGVHHATVIRHVDALEARLATKLFQRHARGYTPTDNGEELLKVAAALDDQLEQLTGRLKGRGTDVSGELVVTTILALAPRLTPILQDFMEEHPGVRIRFITDSRLFRLEYGEAHVALRFGAQPKEPDNIVQKIGETSIGLYASRAYVDRYGPMKEGEWTKHRFISPDMEDSRAPFARWMDATIPVEQIVFRANDTRVSRDAIEAGLGCGFMFRWDAEERDDIVQMLAPREDWATPIWLVTHVDLHRTARVHAFTSFLKDRAREWIKS